MVILELEILKKGSEVGIRIGNPTNLEEPVSSSGPPKPAAAPAVTPTAASSSASARKLSFILKC